jgi:CRISPR/Cas system CMR subunit Cmr4 (Cas7 group RAMP superfamily)
MGAGASASAAAEAVKGASQEDLAAAVKELNDDQKAKILDALKGGEKHDHGKDSNAGPVDICAIPVVAKNNDGLLPQPEDP